MVRCPRTGSNGVPASVAPQTPNLPRLGLSCVGSIGLSGFRLSSRRCRSWHRRCANGFFRRSDSRSPGPGLACGWPCSRRCRRDCSTISNGGSERPAFVRPLCLQADRGHALRDRCEQDPHQVALQNISVLAALSSHGWLAAGDETVEGPERSLAAFGSPGLPAPV